MPNLCFMKKYKENEMLDVVLSHMGMICIQEIFEENFITAR